MSYEKTEWNASVPLSIANLQKIESQYTLALTYLEDHIDAGHPTIYRIKADMDSYFWHAGNDGAGSGLNADTLNGLHASEISGGIPSGFMAWWDPRNGDVPAGWLFCDGNNGTDDMRGRFPIGASSSVPVGTEVGNSMITPEGAITVSGCTLTIDNIHHTHTLLEARKAGDLYSPPVSGTSVADHTVSNPNAATGMVGGGGSHNHPGTFAGNAASLDPIFQYLVIIQKS